MMFDSPHYGIVFGSMDGQVLAATYDDDDWFVGDPDYPHANGWRVISLTGCCGDTVFPKFEA
jgi:hypothetical protein